MDITRQIEYWRSGASEDLEVAVELVKAGDMLPMAPDIETTRNELRQAQEMFEWLIQQL